jgi:hypothetical protein
VDIQNYNEEIAMKHLSLIFIGLFALGFGISAQADTTTVTVEKKTIITPSPKSSTCTTVDAHWDGDVWVDTQTVCTYENRSEGAAWIQEYWACIAFTGDGTCTSWEYRPGHWVKTYP